MTSDNIFYTPPKRGRILSLIYITPRTPQTKMNRFRYTSPNVYLSNTKVNNSIFLTGIDQ